MVSNIPFPTPVGAVRIGKVEGNFVVNPSEEDLAEGRSDLDLVVAGTEEAILMVEAGANEVPEAEILDALDIAHGAIKKLCALQRELAEKAGKEKLEVVVPQVDATLYEQIKASHGQALDEATSVEDKLARQEAAANVEAAVLEQYAGGSGRGGCCKSAVPRSSWRSTSSRSRSSASASPCARCGPTAAARRRSARSRSRSASRRARTARRCSRAGRRRR